MKSPIRIVNKIRKKMRSPQPEASPTAYYAHPRLSSASLKAATLKQANLNDLVSDDEEEEEEIKPKLVWAIHGTQTWWPALLYPSLDDLDKVVRASLLPNDPESYQKFQLHVLALKQFNKGLNNQAVVFLGRPLGDFRLIHDRKSYRRFFGKHMVTMHSKVLCKPKVFSMNEKEYFAFHMGMDEAMSRADMKEKMEESFWAKKAYEAWAKET
eukprot:scaffold24748_cov152-Cylindrotheca_fusiformis.AAC.1